MLNIGDLPGFGGLMIQGQIYNPGSKSFAAVKSILSPPEIVATFTDMAKTQVHRWK